MEATLQQRTPGEAGTAAAFALRHVHMVGVGGSGMSGLAALLMELGATVSGSDLVPFDGMGALVANGARISIGHCAELVPTRELAAADGGLVVRSAAVPDDNAELVTARAAGVKVMQYAEVLGALMRDRVGVAVAGTHGKSTTTAMTAYLFKEAGLDPTYVVGARCDQLNGSTGLGHGPHMIVESCEFNRSFLEFAPFRHRHLGAHRDHPGLAPRRL